MERDDVLKVNDGKTIYPAQGNATQSRLTEVVKLLARIAAERDYTEYIKSQNRID